MQIVCYVLLYLAPCILRYTESDKELNGVGMGLNE